MDLVTCSMDDDRVRPLLDGLERQYEELYGASTEMSRVPASEFDPPDGRFMIGLADGRTVAGGGFRRIDAATCEVKRVWTDPTRRREGLASALLTALEGEARAAGYERLVLETGPRQPEAAALYLQRGYRQVPPFGPYPDDLGFELDLR